MELELQKYEYRNEEYLIYDCSRNRYAFGGREARVMCSQSIGLIVKKVLVGPLWNKKDMTFLIYNPDGTLAMPQKEDVKVFVKYLADAGYERMVRSHSGASCDEEDIRKVCRIAFFESFVEKYKLHYQVNCERSNTTWKTRENII